MMKFRRGVIRARRARAHGVASCPSGVGPEHESGICKGTEGGESSMYAGDCKMIRISDESPERARALNGRSRCCDSVTLRNKDG
jgi:hypothetical protein